MGVVPLHVLLASLYQGMPTRTKHTGGALFENQDDLASHVLKAPSYYGMLYNKTDIYIYQLPRDLLAYAFLINELCQTSFYTYHMWKLA